jgi:hypothetical protein
MTSRKKENIQKRIKAIEEKITALTNEKDNQAKILDNLNKDSLVSAVSKRGLSIDEAIDLILSSSGKPTLKEEVK